MKRYNEQRHFFLPSELLVSLPRRWSLAFFSFFSDSLTFFYHSFFPLRSACLPLPPPSPTVFQATLGNYNLKWQNGDHHRVTRSSEMKWSMKKSLRVLVCSSVCACTRACVCTSRAVDVCVYTRVVHLLCHTFNSVWHLPTTVYFVSWFLSDLPSDAVRGNVV